MDYHLLLDEEHVASHARVVLMNSSFIGFFFGLRRLT